MVVKVRLRLQTGVEINNSIPTRLMKSVMKNRCQLKTHFNVFQIVIKYSKIKESCE